MRWGVRDGSTDDHSTLELCLKELKACQELSTGPNFMVSGEGFPNMVLSTETFNQSVRTEYSEAGERALHVSTLMGF